MTREALPLVDRERTPRLWAILQLELGRALSSFGDPAVTEPAIQACEHALEFFQPPAYPEDWAEAHLALGGLYRMRQAGARGENLARSTRSLDAALEVFTSEHTPRRWFQAHYHRGPAYFFFSREDRGEHRRADLERAEESLRVAIAGTSREHYPEPWASLQGTLGQVYLEFADGDREENLEAARVAFEEALAAVGEVPAHGRPSLVWVLSSRFLGEIYLERQRGDRESDLDRAVEVLEAVQERFPVPDDPPAWTAAQANLAEAHLRKRGGDWEGHRARARECLAATLSLPSTAWTDEDGWAAAQARFLALELDGGGEAEPRPPRPPGATPKREATGSAEVDPADPFDLRRQAEQQVAGLEESLRSGEGPEPLDPGWHVPTLLNEEASLLGHRFRHFAATGQVEGRSPEGRSRLELRRWQLVRLVLEHLQEKDREARRVASLFREVERGQRGFVLFLRGFAFRSRHYETITVDHAGGDLLGEVQARRTLVRDLAPVPVVWIANPVDSAPLEMGSPGPESEGPESEETGAEAPDPEAASFRVESGDTWERDVGALMAAASFIVVHNPDTTPGLSWEIRRLHEAGRLEHTYFHSPEAAEEVLAAESGTCRRLTRESLEHIRGAAAARPAGAGEHRRLPAPACRWVEGSRRRAMERHAEVLEGWLPQLAASRTPISIDLELDGGAQLVALLILLEDRDRLPAALDAQAAALRSLPAEILPQATELARAYAETAAYLRRLAPSAE